MKVTLNYLKNLHFIAQARSFKSIHIDEPESFSGTNLAPSPLEYVLIGIGGCIGNSFIYCLQKHNILSEKLEIIVNGNLKHSGPKHILKLVSIDIELLFTPKSGQSKDKIDLCKKAFHEYCPVSDVVTKETPLSIRIKQEK
ncbi:MAG: OsmC family protein [Candidatus Hodarchaeota archaeon]